MFSRIKNMPIRDRQTSSKQTEGRPVSVLRATSGANDLYKVFASSLFDSFLPPSLPNYASPHVDMFQLQSAMLLKCKPREKKRVS